MHEIFISYRREDSYDATGRIHDWLDYHFGPDAIFRDIDSIRGGTQFPKLLGTGDRTVQSGSRGNRTQMGDRQR